MSASRTVVVTGAAGGIGSEIVDRFLANGDVVVAADLSQETLDAWRDRWDSVATAGQDAALHTVAVDISSEESVDALAGHVRQHIGTTDVLINCAGYFPRSSFEEMSVAEWRRVIDINLTGDFLMIRALLALLKVSGRGRIINIGSGTFFVGTAGQSHYAASKGGVLGLTRVLAREFGDYGITVNFCTPGLTITPAAAKVMPEAVLQEQRATRAIHRDEVPADVIGSIFFLASDEAAFITGQTLNIDGGRYLL